MAPLLVAAAAVAGWSVVFVGEAARGRAEGRCARGAFAPASAASSPACSGPAGELVCAAAVRSLVALARAALGASELAVGVTAIAAGAFGCVLLGEGGWGRDFLGGAAAVAPAVTDAAALGASTDPEADLVVLVLASPAFARAGAAPGLLLAGLLPVTGLLVELLPVTGLLVELLLVAVLLVELLLVAVLLVEILLVAGLVLDAFGALGLAVAVLAVAGAAVWLAGPTSSRPVGAGVVRICAEAPLVATERAARTTEASMPFALAARPFALLAAIRPSSGSWVVRG